MTVHRKSPAPKATPNDILTVFADEIAGRVAARVAEELNARKSKVPERPKQPDFLSESAVAEKTGLSRRTLQSWRARGRGPKWVKLGSRVLYDTRSLAQLLNRE